MPFDATPLRNAVQRLREGLARHQAEPTDEQLRDGLIQRFEFTYELSHRILRRYLAETAGSPDDVTQMPFADLIRAGNAAGLLRGEWPMWRRFRGQSLRPCPRRSGMYMRKVPASSAATGSHVSPSSPSAWSSSMGGASQDRQRRGKPGGPGR